MFSASVILAIIMIFGGILFETSITQKQYRKSCNRILITTFSVYLITAVISSISFQDINHAILVDPFQYFQLLSMKSMDMDPMLNLAACYGLLSDGNELHELCVRYYILFANNYLDGASILYLTLSNVFFGVLAAGAVYRILIKIIPEKKAFKYTLIFVLLSPFHFYSVVFVRDIIVACFFVHAFEIILGKFKITHLLLLVLMIFIVWGIRLYSGIFIICFIFYYILTQFTESRATRIIVGSIVVISIIVALPVIESSDIYSSSTEQLERLQEFDNENSSPSGLTRTLKSLPAGIREVSLTMFSQIMPFPFYLQMSRANTISTWFMGLLSGSFGIFWYMIWFGFLFMFFVYGGYSKFHFNDYILLVIAVVYLLLNLSQPDVRRLMAVYPILFYLYCKLRFLYLNYKGIKFLQMNQVLGFAYICLTCFYLFIKS